MDRAVTACEMDVGGWALRPSVRGAGLATAEPPRHHLESVRVSRPPGCGCAMRHFSMRPAAVMYQRFCFDLDGAWTPVRRLHMAAMMGQEDDLVRLLDQAEARGLNDCAATDHAAGSLVNARDAHDCTAIHWAALGSSETIVLLLLECGADVTARTDTGATALHLAAFNGRLRICQLLLLHGAGVDDVDCEGRTPLYDATFMRSRPCPCDADTPEMQTGATAALLRRAMEAAPEERVALVRRSWEIHVSAVLQEGVEAALDGAAEASEGALSRLLERYREHIDAKDYDGSTALHHAALAGHAAAVGLLVQHRADVSCETNVGEAPLHLAARGGHAVVARLLLHANADVHARARSGRTPLQEAARGLAGSGGAAFAEMEALLGASVDEPRTGEGTKKRAREEAS